MANSSITRRLEDKPPYHQAALPSFPNAPYGPKPLMRRLEDKPPYQAALPCRRNEEARLSHYHGKAGREIEVEAVAVGGALDFVAGIAAGVERELHAFAGF